MEIRQLRYFLAVAGQLNFTRAAEQLHITQPTLSQQIAELESQFGLKLFTRDRKNVALTDAGIAFVEEANAILDRCDKAARRIESFRGGNVGCLTIGKLNYFEAAIIPEVTRILRRSNPGIHVKWKQYSLYEMLSSIESGDADLNLALIPKNFDTPHLLKTVVSGDRMSLVIPKNSAFPDLDTFDPKRIAQLLSRPMFTIAGWYPDVSNAIFEHLRRLCPVLDIRSVTDCSECLINAIVEDGFSLLPYHVALSEDRYCHTCIPLPFDEAEMQVAVLYHRNNQNPCLPLFLDALQDFFCRSE